MKKPIFICLFQQRAAAVFLFATCSVFPTKSLASDPLIANFEEQEPVPVGESSRPDIAPPKTPIVHPEVLRMPAAELAQLLKRKADIVIVDTQPSDGYQMWHIPSAVNIPYVSTANPTDRELMLIALPMNKVIVVYCLCEEGTDSARMALELRRLGYDDDKIKVLEGGLIKWDEKGYPMIKTEVPE
jgi:rhodanese-related sulfurtransferase